MKSIALLMWLAAANGSEQILPVTYFDDIAACEATAQSRVTQYAGQGMQARHKCHKSVPEVGDVDENGNPLPPESRLVSPAGQRAIIGAITTK